MFGLFKTPQSAQDMVDASSFNLCVSHVFTQKADVVFGERGKNPYLTDVHLTVVEASNLRKEAEQSVKESLATLEGEGWNMSRPQALRKLKREYGLK